MEHDSAGSLEEHSAQAEAEVDLLLQDILAPFLAPAAEAHPIEFPELSDGFERTEVLPDGTTITTITTTRETRRPVEPAELDPETDCSLDDPGAPADEQPEAVETATEPAIEVLEILDQLPIQEHFPRPEDLPKPDLLPEDTRPRHDSGGRRGGNRRALGRDQLVGVSQLQTMLLESEKPSQHLSFDEVESLVAVLDQPQPAPPSISEVFPAHFQGLGTFRPESWTT